MNSIGTRLKNSRLGHGLNQKVVADVAGVTNAAVSKWETNGGEAMSAIVAMRLAEHLNVNPFWLVLGKGHPTDEVRTPDVSVEARRLAQRIDRLPDELRTGLTKLLDAIHA
jgi:transcriptional regulator with XRE-family HTH domain